MKIVQLIDTLRSGGAERMAVNIHLALENLDMGPHLFVSRNSGLLSKSITESKGITVFEKKSFYDLNTFWKMNRMLKKVNPQVLHAHSTSLFWAVMLKFFSPKITLIWHDHYGLSDELNSTSKRPERFLLGFVDGIVVVNEKLNQWWQSVYNFPQRKIAIISNFPFLKRSITREAGFRNHFNIVCLANFRRQKDHVTLLRALVSLRKLSPFYFTLNLVGAIDLDPPYTLEIKKMVSYLGLDGQVIFHGESDHVEDILESADIGVLSSTSEGLPVSLLEYGLSGLPTVATDVGDCRVVLADGHFGKLVPSGSSEALTNAILDVSANYNFELQKASEFKAHIVSSYGSEGFLKQYLTFVQNIR